MSEPAFELPVRPDISHLITEDDEPVDNFFQEKEMRLLVNSLQLSWKRRPFVAASDVGLFFSVHEKAIVPDVLVSAGVQLPPDLLKDESKSYYVWEYGKPPDIVIEIVSNTKGGELTTKLDRYLNIRVPHYVVFDPAQRLGERRLRSFTLTGGSYVEAVKPIFPELGLSLSIWEGVFEDEKSTWLRWADLDGALLPFDQELVAQERKRAEQERERAEQERERAERESERADRAQSEIERLREKLRELGATE